DLILRLEVEEVGIRARGVHIAVETRAVDLRETIGPYDRQRPEEHRVDDREERGVEADADGERGDRDNRKCGAAPEPSEREADIGCQVVEQGDLTDDWTAGE